MEIDMKVFTPYARLSRLWGAVFAALLVLFVSCDLFESPDSLLSLGTGSSGTGSFISNYNLQEYVPVPVAGAAPVKRVADREDMVIEVAWRDEKGSNNFITFDVGKVYKATITLTAKDGFSFNPAISFEYPDEMVAEQPKNNTAADKRVLSVTYKGADDKSLNLSPHIPAPVGGASPVTDFLNAGNYFGTIVWEEAGGVPLTGAFQVNTAYTAKVTLRAMSDYTLTGKTLTYAGGTLNGSAEWIWTDNGSTVTGIRIAFPAVSVPAVDPDLTYKIPAPGMGGMPVTYFAAPQYTGTVTWSLASSLTSGTPHSGPFAAHTAYTATVTLTAVSGGTLAGGIFIHSGGTLNGSNEWINTGSTITGIRIAFPATTNVPPVPVTDLDLASKVPAPVAGGTPVTYFVTAQYTGNVDWASIGDAGWTSGMVFQAGRTYTATVKLTPGSGYTLPGAGAAGFTYTGASVTYTAASGVAIIGFPVTGDTGIIPVTDLDLLNKVIAPVTGGTPVTYFSVSQYTGDVAWAVTGGADHTGAFVGGPAYTATVTLNAASGWTFAGIGANTFSHSGAVLVTNTAGAGTTIVVTIAFPGTGGGLSAVTDRVLASYVSVPVAGGMPVTYFPASQYTGNVTWSVTGSGASHAGFAAATAYTATVTLNAASGWTFAGVGANAFTHSGALSVTNPVGTGTQLVVTINFPATGGGLSAVTDRVLASYVPKPVAGGTPVTYFPASQYTVKVIWSETRSGASPTGFAVVTAYTAMVTLNATSGWTFAGVGANAFTHGGALSVTNMAGTGTQLVVTINFPETAVDVGGPVVTDLDLTVKFAAPVAGEVPGAVIFSDQYMGTVNWSLSGGAAHTGPFAAGTVYTATATLYGISGWTFDGIVAGGSLFTYGGSVFTYNGAAAVSNTAGAEGTIVVTIVFPATAGSDGVAQTVTALDLTSYVSKPVTGGTVVWGPLFFTAQYTVSMDWWEPGIYEPTGNSPDPDNSRFEAGQSYTGYVILTAAPGWTFAGLEGTNTFIHREAVGEITAWVYSYSPTSCQVAIKFPATASAQQ
jgi:hypothetical protein